MAASKVMNLRTSGITVRRNSQDFFDSIGHPRRFGDVASTAASPLKAELVQLVTERRGAQGHKLRYLMTSLGPAAAIASRANQKRAKHRKASRRDLNFSLLLVVSTSEVPSMARPPYNDLAKFNL